MARSLLQVEIGRRNMIEILFGNFHANRSGGLIGLLCLLLNLSLAHAQLGPPSSATHSDEKNKEIAQAKIVAAELQEYLLNQQRLANLGSASQHELRVADFEYKLAELRVLSLEYPEWDRRISVSRAKLELDFKSKEFEMLKTLYHRGSVSEAHFGRARTTRDIAKLNYDAAVDGDRDKLHTIRVAKAKLTLARDLHTRAVKLFRSGAISRPDFERVGRNLRIAEERLLLAKKNLGIRVIQVPDASQAPETPSR